MPLKPPDPWTLSLARAALFDHLPKDAILARYENAGGKEISSGKFANPESSAALAANAFGLFIDAPARLSLPSEVLAGKPATSVMLEAEMRFPWSGGRHSWLDVGIESESHLVGIESKRYEPFRDAKTAAFSPAYGQPIWGTAMTDFERLRDGLTSGEIAFRHLDAAQLVKHAFGLRTEAKRRGKKAILIYLYAEPKTYSDGKTVSDAALTLHRREVELFTRAVTRSGGDVSFQALRYAELLECWMRNPDAAVHTHAAAMAERFDL